MQSSRTPQRKGTKFFDTKVLIASLSVAVTFGMWNLFSSEAIQAQNVAPSPEPTMPPQAPADNSLELPPLPTLVPVVDAPAPVENNTVLTNQPAAVNPAAASPAVENNTNNLPLREVGVPTVTIVQKNKPVIASAADSAGGGGGGGGGGGRGAARSRSSRK